jgi:hypothetical protein
MDDERPAKESVAPRPWHLKGTRSFIGIPVLLVFGAILSVLKPWEWYAPALGVGAAAFAFLPAARTRVRLIRALGVGAVVALCLRHLLYVDQVWGGLGVVILTAVALWFSFDAERESVAVPLTVVFGIFLAGTVGLELRLFNTWPLSWLSVTTTVISFALLARLVEHRGAAWTYRGAAAFALVLGELFLALLFWPTVPTVGGAVLALVAGVGMLWLSTPTGENRRAVRAAVLALSVLLAVLLVSARWA